LTESDRQASSDVVAVEPGLENAAGATAEPPLLPYYTTIMTEQQSADLGDLSAFHGSEDLVGARGGHLSVHGMNESPNFPPIDFFDHSNIFDFGAMAAQSFMQHNARLPPTTYIDQPLEQLSPPPIFSDPLSMDMGGLYGSSSSSALDPSLEPNDVKMALQKPSHFVFSESMWQNLAREVQTWSPNILTNGVKLPNFKVIQATIRTYIDCFDPNLPIIHIPSLVLDGAPTPLLLAMCAIGSLYRLERKVAADFYHLANDTMSQAETVQPKHRLRRLSNVFGTPAGAPSLPQPEQPIWKLQTRLLLSFFALFTWDGALAQNAFDDLASLSHEFRRRSSPARRAADCDRRSSWASWIEKESTRRALCGILIVDSLSAVTYGSVPGAYYEEADMEVPDDDRLWRCASAAKWQMHISSEVVNAPLKLEKLLSHIIQRNEPGTQQQSGYNWSSSLFAVVVAMHALNIHVLHIALAAQALRILPPNQEEEMRTRFWASIDTALNACRKAFEAEDPDVNPWRNPLLSNCLVVLRIALMRECTDSIRSFNRRVLLGCDSAAVRNEIQAYVLSTPLRGRRITEAVKKAFSVMLYPISNCAELVRKTAALTWSIEHAIAWW
jgi:Fungal specific transcription factor domain